MGVRGGEEAGWEGACCPRGSKDSVFPQSVAPVPVWQVTLGESQGSEAGIAQAQEKGHKGKQCGECSAGRDGAGGLGCGAGHGLQESESTGDPPPAQAVQEGRGSRPRGGEIQREQGKRQAWEKGASV